MLRCDKYTLCKKLCTHFIGPIVSTNDFVQLRVLGMLVFRGKWLPCVYRSFMIRVPFNTYKTYKALILGTLNSKSLDAEGLGGPLSRRQVISTITAKGRFWPARPNAIGF
jgi:hypothetical protein